MKLLDGLACDLKDVIEGARKLVAVRLQVLCLGPYARSLPMIARKGEHLVLLKKVDFSSIVMPDANAAKVRRQHTVGCNNDSVVTKESDNNGHPWKTLLTFISGYRL